jgi:formylglycine-generating enzyme required for sulfatase activity
MKTRRFRPRRTVQQATSPNTPGAKRPWIRWAVFAGVAAAGFLTTYLLVAGTRHSPPSDADASPPAADASPPSTPEKAKPEAPCCPDPGDSSEKEATTPPAADAGGVAPRINRSEAPGPAPEGMVWIPGGVYWRGNDTKRHGDARPWHLVEVDGFWMDAAVVTNEQFAKFVKATGYDTVAERKPKAEDFPGAPPDKLVAGSVVFTPPKGPVPLNNHLRWWSYVPGANWQHPEGPDSDLKGRAKHPVVHVAYEDALAYCKWAGKRLPTEAEFEFAARGGLNKNQYAWGDEFRPGGKFMANTWQGRFPYENTGDDGYKGTAPVGSFPPNRFGLSDMAGNVWQWCSDWYRHDYYRTLAAPAQPARNPQGPADSFDPSEPRVAKRVMRGGSYLCTDQYCTAYEVGARGKGAPDTGTNHLSFRCVKSAR